MDGERIVVTGGSGLLGSNICRLAAGAGRDAVGLVRKESDAKVLRELGARAAVGDILDPDSLDRAFKGASGVIHCAAVIGGTWSKAKHEDFDSVNYRGVLNVLDRAAVAGVARIVLVSSMIIADSTITVTERSPLMPVSHPGSPYLKAKLASYYEGMHRACRGQHINFVVPAAMYGPSPFVDRALEPTLFTGTLYMAITGRLDRYARFPLAWPFVDDAARVCLAALDKGRSGERYLAVGRNEDVRSLAQFCNLACEQAGVKHRVADLDPATMGDELGSMKALAEMRFATPLLDPSGTTRELGVELTPLETGIARTVDWLRAQKRI
jgi:dihydroflavonol-4-reductase